MRAIRVYVTKVKVRTRKEHIEGGKCGDPRACMERMACMEALHEKGIRPTKLRVDAGHFKGVWGGWRWEASTPRGPHNALIQFDDELDRNVPVTVLPHEYTLKFQRGSKVQKAPKFTKERLEQIKQARFAREKMKGTSDRKRYSRVIGHTYI